MDGVEQWRVVGGSGEPEDDRPPKPTPQPAPREHASLLLIGATVVLVVAAAGLAIWATLPSGGVAFETGTESAGQAVLPQGLALGPVHTDGPAAVGVPIVVDVEGAVIEPGLHALPPDSRVGDAIAAAGGYGPVVDIVAAGRQLNLAQKLTDGMQLWVPALDDDPATAPAPSPAPAGAAVGDVVDINHASADELDTLPGVGPVTAAKIIAAREEAPFASIDELQARGIVGAATFEKLKDLVSVGP
jgi:competence protein ComEA